MPSILSSTLSSIQFDGKLNKVNNLHGKIRKMMLQI